METLEAAQAAPVRDIATLVTLTPTIVLIDAEKREDLFKHIRSEIAAFEPDLKTDKGRKAIASFSRKIVTTKTMIDDAGGELIAEARKTVDSVNVERKTIRDTLDGLRDLARKPLTDWEEAEQARKDACEAAIKHLRNDAVVALGVTAADVLARRVRVADMALDKDVYLDLHQSAVDVQAATLASLDAAYARLLVEEANAAELAALRAAQAETARINKIAEDARQEAAAEAERDRLAQLRETEAASAAGAIEREEAAKAVQAAQAEADELRRQRDLKAMQETAAANEQAARNADIAHRKATVKLATEAVMLAGGIGEDRAGRIVLSILAGQVPHVTLKF